MIFLRVKAHNKSLQPTGGVSAKLGRRSFWKVHPFRHLVAFFPPAAEANVRLTSYGLSKRQVSASEKLLSSESISGENSRVINDSMNLFTPEITTPLEFFTETET